MVGACYSLFAKQLIFVAKYLVLFKLNCSYINQMLGQTLGIN